MAELETSAEQESGRLGKGTLKAGFWALLIALVGVLSVVPLFRPTRLISQVFNFGHVVFFGLVAYGLLSLSRRLLARWLNTHAIHYLVAFVGVGLLGLAIEVVQYFGPRDADLGDLLRDIVGGGVALVVLLSFDESARREVGWLGRRPGVLRLFGVVLLSLTLLPLLLVSMATLNRDAAFPQIASFETRGESWFRIVEDEARLQIVDSEEVQPGWTSGRAARVVFEGGLYPGLAFYEPVADWRGYRELAFTVFSPEMTAVDLHLRVHDFEHDFEAVDSYHDRFNSSLTIEPGVNDIRIPLDEIEHGPVERLIDMSQIDAIVLFLVEPHAPITLYIDDVRLE